MRASTSVIGLATLLAAVMLGCLATRHDSSVPVPDFALLAPEVLRNTPEHLHFAPGAHFDWVLLELASDTPKQLANAVVRALEQRYLVFRSPSELPARYVQRNQVGRIYVRGFYFSLRAVPVADDTFRLEYHDYEGPLAGSASSTTYRWTGSRWVVVDHDPGVVY